MSDNEYAERLTRIRETLDDFVAFADEEDHEEEAVVAKAGLVLGGLPTGPDVKKLVAAFPDIKPGDVIEYDDVEDVLGFKRKERESRWRTVTDAWRRFLKREHNFLLVPLPKENAFKRLTENERSSYDFQGTRTGLRKVLRTTRDMHLVDTAQLSQKELQSHTHKARVMTAIIEHSQSTIREIEPPPAVKSLPKGSRVPKAQD